LAEQVKNNVYTDNPDNIMNLAQAMLTGRSLEAFLKKKRLREAKNRIHKTKTQMEHTPNQIYDFTIFELSFERLTSKVDGGMTTRGKESTSGDTSSWVRSTLRNPVKDCKT
jgi:hypothetical protein